MIRNWRLPSFSSPRTRRALLVLTLLALLGITLYLARGALLPYVLGLVAAYILVPAVNFLERHMPVALKKRRLSRPLAIALLYVLIALILAGLIAFLVPLIADQVRLLWEHREQLARDAQDLVQTALGQYHQYAQFVPEAWRISIENSLSDFAGSVMSAFPKSILNTFSAVTNGVSLVLGFFVIPFWLFYLLNDDVYVRRAVVQILPERYRDEILTIYRLVDRILSAYLRGQLLLCVFIGSMATIGLLIVGVDFALILGLIAGMLEILPYIGPILGALPAVLVALLSSPIQALWVAVVFVAIQQIENLFLTPRVAGHSVKLHPAIIMVVLVIGNELFGLVGMLLAVPFTAILRDLFKYAYLRLGENPLPPREALERLGHTALKLDV